MSSIESRAHETLREDEMSAITAYAPLARSLPQKSSYSSARMPLPSNLRSEFSMQNGWVMVLGSWPQREVETKETPYPFSLHFGT
jgi:hypothetical protein